MTCRRFFVLLHGMIRERLEGDDLAEFDALMTGDAAGLTARKQEAALAAVVAMGGEIG